jgi:GDPmannose 4,6-dehydratase
MFGAAKPPQDENTEFYPRSPYGVAKVYSYWITKNYREAYGMHASNGILFNHESPRRGETFVTRKITRAVARIAMGQQKELFLGNLDARRDWGYAPEYVVAMWQMLQQPDGDDFVVATNTDLSVKDFVELSFKHVNLNWKDYVRFDERYLRPTEVDTLVGDFTKAKNALSWEPSVGPEQLAAIMVEHDLAAINGHVADVPRGSVWQKAVSK